MSWSVTYEGDDRDLLDGLLQKLTTGWFVGVLHNDHHGSVDQATTKGLYKGYRPMRKSPNHIVIQPMVDDDASKWPSGPPVEIPIHAIWELEIF